MVRGPHGADGLARSVATVLAKDGKKACLCIGPVAFPVALDANPCLSSALEHPIFFIQCHVVFRLACHYARLAAGALVGIDDHAPPVTFRFGTGLIRRQGRDG